MDGCMTLGASVVIRFCPHCGIKLSDFYRDTWQDLPDEKLSEEFPSPFA
jgi:hypothetical protein